MRPTLFPTALFLHKPLCIAMLACCAAGCAIGPDYQRPDTTTPAAYKEAQGWVVAAPADALARGPWWQLFKDPQLDQLAAAVEVSNQNVAAAAAAYAQARALVAQQRGAMFPTVSLTGNAGRNGGSGALRTGDSYSLGIGASWEPDVWGRLGRNVDNANASAQASAADLASARLSAQGELAVNYLSLRQTDAQRALLQETVAAYQRVVQITRNRYSAGIAAKTDVLQAETQLANAQSDDLGLARQRTVYEHAIAVLIGKSPSEFTLPAAIWQPTVPEVPVGVPSTLLQRRPDIAAAERRMAAANEQIGIAKSGYFPSLGLNASYGSSASRVADLFSVSNLVWSLGLSAVQTLFNAGVTGAKVEGAQAGYDQTVARYRQTVLTAFQNVEDELTAARVLEQQLALRRQASQAADEAEQKMLNRYKAGQVSYTEVATVQASALSARRALVQAQADRQTTAVALIQSLGGSWDAGRVENKNRADVKNE
ncbi:MAG: efflux transporter outer membrane subunit [Proteobacteria bacterium]|nr:efflux transporter outer membrane subunit [Pseudomonadota bacterium]